MKEPEMGLVGGFIGEILAASQHEAVQESVKGKIRDLCERFPLYDPLM